MIFTIDRINAILRAEGMPRCEDFTKPMRSISREAQACGALERKYRMSGLDLEHLRFWMKGGQRVRMLLGERVNALEAHAELNRDFVPAHGRWHYTTFHIRDTGDSELTEALNDFFEGKE